MINTHLHKTKNHISLTKYKVFTTLLSSTVSPLFGSHETDLKSIHSPRHLQMILYPTVK